MLNIGSGEIAFIAVVALLILGPKRLPELARGIGKFMREFRRQTNEVRGVVEREFYKMDQEVSIHEPPLSVTPASHAIAHGAAPEHDSQQFHHSEAGEALMANAHASQALGGAPQGEPLPAPKADSSSPGSTQSGSTQSSSTQSSSTQSGSTEPPSGTKA